MDDEESGRKLLRVYLKWYGFEIVEAISAKGALQEIRKKRPDLIFTDIKMPEMDGCQFTEILKKSPQWGDIPVIAVTALVMKEEAERIRNTCDGFIAKPFDRNLLIAELKRHLEFSEVQAEPDAAEAPDTAEPPDAADIVNQELLENLPQLLDMLENEIKPAWDQLNDALTIKKVKAFSEKVLDAGIAHHCAALQTWGMNLRQLAEAFEMEKLNGELQRFPEIYKNLQNMTQS